jgi:membrane-bound metal-dependent hydrolase YbcI (DUF457 family)
MWVVVNNDMMPVTHMVIGAGLVRFSEATIGRLATAPGDRLPLDYRFAIFGAILPDLIDKPLKYWIIPDSLPDSHVYGHTLLLPLFLILAGLVLARRGDLRLLVVGIGCLSHPLVDPVNTYPRTLFWPLLGTEFPDATQPWRNYFQTPLEIALIATGVIALWRTQTWRQRGSAFLRRGTFPGDETPRATRATPRSATP